MARGQGWTRRCTCSGVAALLLVTATSAVAADEDLGSEVCGLADHDGDGRVGLRDFSRFIDRFRIFGQCLPGTEAKSGPCVKADVDGDEVVSQIDILAMTQRIHLQVECLGRTLAPRPPPRVLVVGLDGGTWKVVDVLIESGHLPVLGELVRGGARADLDCKAADWNSRCFCPPVWTAMATGRDLAAHGMRLVEHDPADRRVAALWTVLDRYGGRSALAAWRNTNPPEPEPAFVITEPGADYAGSLLQMAWSGSGVPFEPEPAATDTKPEGLFETLGILPYAGTRLPAWGIFARDRATMRGVFELTRRPKLTGFLNLTMFILHSPDKSEHVTWGWIQDEPGGPIDEERLLALADGWTAPINRPGPFGFGDSTSQYLEADMWLGKLLHWNAYDYVFLVSDHGMSRWDGSGLQGQHGPMLHPEAHVGIFAMRGPGVRAGLELDGVTVLDVAPTVAYALGLPVGDDLPGRVLTEAFTQEWLADHPAATVPTWEAPIGAP